VRRYREKKKRRSIISNNIVRTKEDKGKEAGEATKKKREPRQ